MVKANYRMSQMQKPHKYVYFFGILILFIVSATNCNSTQTEPEAMPTPPAIDQAEGTAGFLGQQETIQPDTANRQLLIWAPAMFEDLLNLESNPTLATVYEQFERSHNGVHIDAQIHAEHGEASLLNYLRSAQRLAPTILPDIILIDTRQLWQVGDLGLLHPLTQQQLSQASSFFGVATNAVTYQEEIVGIPYLIELTHMLAKVTEDVSPPLTWNEFYESNLPLNFVAGKSENLNDFAYLQYLGAEEMVTGNEVIIGDRLLEYFIFLSNAQERGLLGEAVLENTNAAAVWNAFVNTEYGMAETTTHVMLEHWDVINNGEVQYGPLFGNNGAVRSAAHIWAFVVVTNDTQQQELSFELVRTLLEPEVHSQWSRIALQIPTQQTAFDLWRNPAAYYTFIQQELSMAFAYPSSRRFADINRRLQYAQELVLRQEMTPEEAVIYVQAAP